MLVILAVDRLKPKDPGFKASVRLQSDTPSQTNNSFKKQNKTNEIKQNFIRLSRKLRLTL